MWPVWVRYGTLLGVSLEQVQSAIRTYGALIEYLRYPHYLGKGNWEPRYGTIVIFANGPPLWIPLGKASEIEHLVRRLSSRCQVRSKGSLSARMES
jgi:hypothetical protein